MTPSAYIENQLWFSTDAEGAIELQIRTITRVVTEVR